MARAIWTGVISFGLVTVPVRLYAATSSHRPTFHQFERGSGQRVRNRRVTEDTGAVVDHDDIVMGADIGDGRHVIVTPEELETIEPGRSRAIVVEDFVDPHGMDPVVWDTTYYLGPDGDAAEVPYELLRRAMINTGRVAIARFVMRDKQYLATIRPLGELLGLSTMYFADEIRGVDVVDRAPVDREPDDLHLEIAQQLIRFMSVEWDHPRYRDTHQERVDALIARKARGEHVVGEAQAPAPAGKGTGLLEALRRSIAERARAGRGRSAGTGPTRS